MRKLFILLLVAGLAILTAIPAFAITTEFTGTLTHGDPYIEGVVADSPDCDESVSVEWATHYHVIDFNAPVSGLYEYVNYWNYELEEGEDFGAAAGGKVRGAAARAAIPEGTVIDVVIQLYPAGTFNPDDTLENCLLWADDYSAFELAAGDYDLVVMSYWYDEAGPYYFTITGPDVDAAVTGPLCPYPLPDGSVVYNIPAGAPAFYEASLDTAAGFNIPAGTWYVSEFSGDFALVWISCEGSPVWVPSNAVAH